MAIRGRLGRNPVDPVRLAAAPAITDHAAGWGVAPPSLVRPVFSPGLDGNDTIGDCSAVGIMNAARASAILTGWTGGILIPPSDTITLYSDSTGYDPADPTTDQGAVLLDVLAWQLRNGIIWTGHSPLVADYATVDHTSIPDLAAAMFNLKIPLYLGIDLAQADQDTSLVWDVTTPGDQTPGTYSPDGGGHCVLLYSYQGLGPKDLVFISTWGIQKLATWDWVLARGMEAHALLFPLFHANNMVDYASLRNAMWQALA